MTSATPLASFKQTGALASLHDLFWGNISGSIGETCVPAILFKNSLIYFIEGLRIGVILCPVFGGNELKHYTILAGI